MLLKEFPVQESTQHGTDYAELVAKAQLKKVVEWGNDFCMDNSHYGKREHNRKGLCLMCWQALLEEIT